MSDSYPHVPASKTDLAKRKTIYGHGVNDAPYATCLRIEGAKNECPYYTKWRSMLLPGNKLYSPETCMFIEVKVNRVLRDNAGKRGAWPLGVHYRKSRRAFIAKVRDACGKEKSLGQFSSPEEAHKAWRLAKIEVLDDVRQGQADIHVKNALLRHIERLAT